MDICRRTIRQQLGREGLRHVDELHLPPILKRYILYKPTQAIMGNVHANVSRQSTSSDISANGMTGMCPRGERLHSCNSSTDSEGNNNSSHKKSFASDTEQILQSASHTIAPMKQRKVSRAASAGKMRPRRHLPGFASLSGKGDGLNDSTRTAVAESWIALTSVFPDQTTVGLGIYQKIFSHAPELRPVFGVTTEVHSCVEFHRSAKLFVSVIELCVRNIHNVEAEMGPVLVMYGRRHYHREDQGFRTHYLPLFASCIWEFVDENLPEEARSDEEKQGWQALLTFLSAKIAEGVELERQRTSSIRRKSVL